MKVLPAMTDAGTCAPLPYKLVCPRCRVSGPEGRLTIRYLEDDPARNADLCRGCHSLYPRIDGIRCVPPHLDSFLSAQRASLEPGWLLQPDDLPAALSRCTRLEATDPESPEFREELLPGKYALAHFPESPDAGRLSEELAPNQRLSGVLQSWLERHWTADERGKASILEVGCGPGRMLLEVSQTLPESLTGFDLRVSMLRVARRLADGGEVLLPFIIEGQRAQPLRIRAAPCRSGMRTAIRLVQGDVMDPPFEAGAFTFVLALSLLDTVAEPFIALGQLDALLAPGGLLFLAQPYHWEVQATPARAWWTTTGVTGAEVLRRTLLGQNLWLPHFSYEILEEVDDLCWALPASRRLVHRYFMHALLARKSLPSRRP
jgi:SAM-dependent methyltransferase